MLGHHWAVPASPGPQPCVVVHHSISCESWVAAVSCVNLVLIQLCTTLATETKSLCSPKEDLQVPPGLPAVGRKTHVVQQYGIIIFFLLAPSCKLFFRTEEKPFCFIYCLLNILTKEIRGCGCHTGTVKLHFSNAFKLISISLTLRVQNMCLEAFLSNGSRK